MRTQAFSVTGPAGTDRDEGAAMDLGQPLRPRPYDRNAALEFALASFGSKFLSEQAPVGASYLAGKVFQRLMSRISDRNGAGGPPPAFFQVALKLLKARDDDGPPLANCLSALGMLASWRVGKAGPYASVNFEKSHGHASLVGPDGLERRNDVQVGLTLLDCYGRFPDTTPSRSRVYLLLSKGELRIGDQAWERADYGRVFLTEARTKFALRCTGQPLLAAWCENGVSTK